MSDHASGTAPAMRRYLGLVCGGAALGLGLVLVFNLAYDPLWYFQGNRLGPFNFAFNERLSKPNQFLKIAPDRLDCLILGSSRATLIQTRDVPGHHCFNFAVSSGGVEESVALARYAQAHGVRAKRLLISLDDFNFMAPGPGTIPDFIRRLERPPWFLFQYLSIDTLAFSLRLRRGDSPLDRVYDRRFQAVVRPGRPPYRPCADPEIQVPLGHPLTAEKITQFSTLRDLFPEAALHAYLPPQSIPRVRRLLTGYGRATFLTLMVQAGRMFDSLHDFAIPSAVTADATLTYDGSHYLPEVNRRLVAAILAGEDGFGLRVDGLPLERYLAAYDQALVRFGAECQPP
ncbi:MAG: hypothetical protein HQL82_05960 [Magnetococcales bacterium]|nr:hypothetical protein [Magnetococcales bacterium]